MKNEYNNYTSMCDMCRARGYHTKREKCVRQYTTSCQECGSKEFGKLAQCKGTNRMIDYSQISKKFAPYYVSQNRIKVRFAYGDEKSGTVSMTGGLRPSFMLMLRSNSRGSSYLLSDNDVIL